MPKYLVPSYALLTIAAVLTKCSGDNAISRNLRSSRRRTTVYESLPSEVVTPSSRKIRYAAFGTSITWGSEIYDRERLSYVKLLSLDAVNLGIRGAGPNYASACTQSMVGDRVFDVIILEYLTVQLGFDLLVYRLRTRFPDAIIIFLYEWTPLLITNQEGVNVRKWAEDNFGMKKIHYRKMHTAFFESMDTWKWSDQDRNRKKLLDEIAVKYDAYVLKMPRPKQAKNWFHLSHLFVWDFIHKSNAGHEEVAERVRKFVETLPVVENPRIGKWEHVDWCQTWFESGNISQVKMIESFTLRSFSYSQKYALELDDINGSIVVFNPSQEPMYFYITYMITSPIADKYPRVKASLKDTYQEPVILEQVAPEQYGKMKIHIHIMKKIGTVSPGYTKVEFERLEDSQWPFRLVSVAITGEELKFVRAEPVF